MKRAGGFTLIELMVVVAIIAIVAAIAIPNLLRSRINANEATAIANLKAVHDAQTAYHAVHKAFGDFPALTTDDNPPCLHGSWGTAPKNGYNFACAVDNVVGFRATAVPEQAGVSGVRHFYIDASGVVRVGDDETGTPIDE